MSFIMFIGRTSSCKHLLLFDSARTKMYEDVPVILPNILRMLYMMPWTA